MSTTSPRTTKVTRVTLERLRQRGEKAVFLTAYDYPTAVLAERAGVDMLLVGDSAAMTMLGHPGTVAITLDEMLIFAKAVCRGARHAFVVGDLPFMSYQISDSEAVRSAGSFIAAGCDAVKCEGGARIAPRVRAMTEAGIAVMGHIGLTPQSLGQLGGFRVQGRTPDRVRALVDDALRLQEAGAFSLLLEAVPPDAGAAVRDALEIPVYGIGAGPHVDGQLVIVHDILGNFIGDITPRFVSRYANLDTTIVDALQHYAADVREGRFPGPEHCYEATPTPLSAVGAA